LYLSDNQYYNFPDKNYDKYFMTASIISMLTAYTGDVHHWYRGIGIGMMMYIQLISILLTLQHIIVSGNFNTNLIGMVLKKI
jgi:hypothetical protein